MKIAKEKETVSPLAEHHQATAREKISYSIYFLGQGLVYTIVSQCLMYYYTDSVLMAPAVVSIILAIGKVWDAVNDTLFGLIVDAVKFKSGHKFFTLASPLHHFDPIEHDRAVLLAQCWHEPNDQNCAGCGDLPAVGYLLYALRRADFRSADRYDL